MLKDKTADQVTFGTVNVLGNPVAHAETNSASTCINFRPMPGGWLRSWGGRKARKFNAVTGVYRQFHQFRDLLSAGWPTHMSQYKQPDGVVKWKTIHLDNYLEQDIETITPTYDMNDAATRPVAVTNLRERVVYYNGLGLRNATNSRPPFSGWDATNVQYFGLDCFCPSGLAPTVAGAGGGTIDLTDGRVKVYVGWHNADTLHFGNGKYMGDVAGATGVSIAVSNLQRLSRAVHSSFEEANLRYVFYATLPGLSVPYLLMGTDGITPLMAQSTDDTYSITAMRHDVTKEMPITNFPPKPMRWLANVGGRMYGALIDTTPPGGLWPVDDFNYQTGNPRLFTGVFYSAASNDLKGRSYLGNPEESWPTGVGYFSQSPNSMVPIYGMPSPDESSLIVFTAVATYAVIEAADKVHTWTPVSIIHGIRQGNTACSSSRGLIWLTQRNQIVMMGFGKAGVELLSAEYQHLLTDKSPTFATYTLDPINQIDRYEVYFTDGTGVVHDFLAGGGYQVTGNYTCGKTLVDSGDRGHHLLANSSVYTQAGQVEAGLVTGREKIADEAYDPTGAIVVSPFTSVWGSQWLNYQRPVTRKQVVRLALYADGGGQRANPFIDIQMYADTAGMGVVNRVTATGVLNIQSGGPMGDVSIDEKTGLALYEFKFSKADYFKFKWLIIMIGRLDVLYHPMLNDYGNGVDYHANLAGAVFSLHHEIQERGNG
jgi:hypothetical protein